MNKLNLQKTFLTKSTLKTGTLSNTVLKCTAPEYTGLLSKNTLHLIKWIKRVYYKLINLFK